MNNEMWSQNIILRFYAQDFVIGKCIHADTICANQNESRKYVYQCTETITESVKNLMPLYTYLNRIKYDIHV